MKVSTAALPFLILAAVLGPPTHGSPARGLELVTRDLDHPRIQNPGMHRPATCCYSYTSRSIQCKNMKDYFLTTSGCPLPAVIFKTRGGQKVCFQPDADGVQECMGKLDSANTWKTVG